MKSVCVAAAFTLVVLMGCSRNEYGGPDLPGSKARIYGTIEAVESMPKGASWNTGDQIAISVDSGDVNSTNIKYQFVGGTMPLFEAAETSSDIYVKGSKGMRFTAYYPYQGTNGTAAGLIDVATTSENQLSQNRNKIDFLFAAASATREMPDVQLNFGHQLSQLRLVFQSEQDISGEITLKLSGLLLTGTFDTSTGEATATGDNTDILDITLEAGAARIAPLIVLPQTIGEAALEVGINGRFFTATINNLTLESGYIHPYTITISGDGITPVLTVTPGNITQWVSGGEQNIDSSGL